MNASQLKLRIEKYDDDDDDYDNNNNNNRLVLRSYVLYRYEADCWTTAVPSALCKTSPSFTICSIT
jgi:hypothetical protein